MLYRNQGKPSYPKNYIHYKLSFERDNAKLSKGLLYWINVVELADDLGIPDKEICIMFDIDKGLALWREGFPAKKGFIQYNGSAMEIRNAIEKHMLEMMK